MKQQKKVTRIPLVVDETGNITIMGLVSHDPDYKVSLSINRILGISLRNISPFELPGPKAVTTTYSRFRDSSDPHGLIYTLVSNRNGNSHLVRKLVNIDYLFFLQVPDQIPDSDSLAASLRDIDGITAVFNINCITIQPDLLDQMLNQEKP